MFILGHTPSFFVLCLASFFGFFGTHPDHSLVLALTLLQYSLGFYPSSILAQTLLRYLPGPFFGTRPNPFLMLTWILPISQYSLRSFFGTPLDSTLFWYSLGPFFGIHPDSTSFPVLAQTLLRYSLGFHPFSVLTRTLLRYSPEFYPFSVLTRKRSLLQHHAWISLGSLVLART